MMRIQAEDALQSQQRFRWGQRVPNQQHWRRYNHNKQPKSLQTAAARTAVLIGQRAAGVKALGHAARLEDRLREAELAPCALEHLRLICLGGHEAAGGTEAAEKGRRGSGRWSK
jgi:hypothetical protein